MVLSYLDDVLILGTNKALVSAQNAAKEECPPTGFDLNETKNIWFLPQGIQQPACLQGERVDIPEVMRCEALAPPVLPEPNADPGQFVLREDRNAGNSWRTGRPTSNDSRS